MNFPKTAFILGAGLGTRLRPLTEKCPKPLLPLGGKPIICHAMDALLELGVERFIVNTHHAAEVYTEKFPENRYREAPITLVHEPVLLDTGGGLKNIEPLLKPEDKNLLVYNGDILANLDLKKLVTSHLASRANATLLLRSDAAGNVNFDENSNVVCDLRDRLGRSGTHRCRFTGIYCVSREFFNLLTHGKIESVVEAFLRAIETAPESIRGVLDNTGSWQDLGTLDEYAKAQMLF